MAYFWFGNLLFVRFSKGKIPKIYDIKDSNYVIIKC